MRHPPCPGGGAHDADEQDPGLVDRALKRHRLAGNGGHSTLERVFIQSGIGSFEKARHFRTPLKQAFRRGHFKWNSRSRILVLTSYRFPSPGHNECPASAGTKRIARFWRPTPAIRPDRIVEFSRPGPHSATKLLGIRRQLASA